jgi:Tfp pilus assembly ATPase PilU
MQTFNQSLIKLIKEGLIDYEMALHYATSPEELRLAFEGVGTGVTGIALGGGNGY